MCAPQILTADVRFFSSRSFLARLPTFRLSNIFLRIFGPSDWMLPPPVTIYQSVWFPVAVVLRAVYMYNSNTCKILFFRNFKWLTCERFIFASVSFLDLYEHEQYHVESKFCLIYICKYTNYHKFIHFCNSLIWFNEMSTITISPVNESLLTIFVKYYIKQL